MEQPIKIYSPLGNKTFALLVAKRAMVIFVLVIVLILISVFKNFVPVQFVDIVNSIILTGILVITIFLCLIILAGKLEYSHYAITIDQDNFKVRRGLISVEETAVPYRRVKEVVVKRGATEQIWGVSTIVITILGEEEGLVFSKETVITLPFIEKTIAAEIQNQIVERAGHAQ